MAGYPSEGTLGELLSAMRDQAKQASALATFETVAITGGAYSPTYNEPALYIVPFGKRVVDLGYVGTQQAVRVEWWVSLEIVKHGWAMDDDTFIQKLVGTSDERGLSQLVEDVEEWLTRNWFGLSGLDQTIAPVVEPPASGGYAEIDQPFVDDDGEEHRAYFTVAQVVYKVQTIPFELA